MKSCIAILYFVGIILLLLSIYLNEVIKQDFGVKKSPFFIFEKLLRIKRSKTEIEYTPMEEESSSLEDDSVIA